MRRAKICNNSGTRCAGSAETKPHGHEVPFAQRLLKRAVELLRRKRCARSRIHGHELLVELDDLVDDLGMRGSDGGKSALLPSG